MGSIPKNCIQNIKHPLVGRLRKRRDMGKIKAEEVRRHPQENPYTLVLNSMLQRDDLTFHQKGMMAELWSKPEDWIIYKSWLMKRSELGRDAFNRQWNDLQAKGYLVKEYIRDDKGCFSKVIWHLYEVPVKVKEEVKVLAEEEAKVERKETAVANEIKEIAEQEFEAVFTTLEAMDDLDEEEKETIKDEIINEFDKTFDKRWVQENFKMAWEETLENLKCRERLVFYLINNMKNRYLMKRLKNAQEAKKLATPQVSDFYIPMDGPWNGHN